MEFKGEKVKKKFMLIPASGGLVAALLLLVPCSQVKCVGGGGSEILTPIQLF